MSAEIPFVDHDVRVVYDDPMVLAVAKPSGTVVHHTRGAGASPVLVRTLERASGIKLYPVHRLDRQASGLVVLAKSSEVARRLSEDLREQRWRKAYLVLCRGVIAEPCVIDHPVPEDDKRRDALTEIEPLEVYCRRYTLARARPRSGRRHQLRYHFKHLGHPLVGDTNYGQGPINRFFRTRFALHRLFLHAETLALPHPDGRGELNLSCPLAEELERVLLQLSHYEGPVA